jgi:RNA polymerase sigma factor (sigma-70 family)
LHDDMRALFVAGHALDRSDDEEGARALVERWAALPDPLAPWNRDAWPALVAIARARLWGAPEVDPEDVVQESIFGLAARPDGFEGRSRFFTYVARAVIRRAVDAVRAAQRRRGLWERWRNRVAHLVRRGHPPDRTMEHRERLRRCLERLEPERRELVRLWAARTTDTVGILHEALAISSEAMRKRLSRALDDLRACLEKDGSDD